MVQVSGKYGDIVNSLGSKVYLDVSITVLTIQTQGPTNMLQVAVKYGDIVNSLGSNVYLGVSITVLTIKNTRTN